MPSTRVLAAALGLSRGTVTLAYEQLIAEGFFQAERGAGTRVASDLTLPDKSPNDRLRDSAIPPLSARAQRYARAAGQISPMPAVPFAVSVPAGDTLPDDIWRRIGNRIRARGPGAPSGYGEPAGAPELREAIAEYVRKSRSVRCHAGQVIITSGTQQG
ncbi:DNA-binding protein, partial [Streptomyces griseofuscus]